MNVYDFDEQIEKCWNKNEKKISAWYLAQKKPDDLIISASPACIIGPIATRLGVHYMATDGEEKWVVCPENTTFSRKEIEKQIQFQEKFYQCID